MKKLFLAFAFCGAFFGSSFSHADPILECCKCGIDSDLGTISIYFFTSGIGCSGSIMHEFTVAYYEPIGGGAPIALDGADAGACFN